MYGKLWETQLRFIRVQDQRKYFWKDIHVCIDSVTRFRGASLWEWLGGSTFFSEDGQRITEINQGTVGSPGFL